MKKVLFLFIVFHFYTGILAQKVSNPLNKFEIDLMNLLDQDTADFFCTIDNNEFKFGADLRGATFVNLTKNKGRTFINPLGTGRLYEILKEQGTYKSVRVDSTIHSGVNFFSKSFFVRDTLYQFGGLGFWTIRGLMTFFSPQTNQWELIQSNRAIPSFFDNNQDATIHIDNNKANPKLYLSNAYYYIKYPQSFDLAAKDTCFEFDFNTKNWSALGKINPELKRILLGKNTLAFDMGKYLLVQSALEFYWINFEDNSYGKFKTKYNSEIRQVWLSIYNTENKTGIASFQFNIGKHIYFIKLDKNKELDYKRFVFDIDMIDLNSKDYIYSNKIDYIGIITNFLDDNKTILLTLLAFTALLIFIIKTYTNRHKMPKEVVSILNNNFFSALTIVEKELIEVLYQHHLKGEALSTKLINKIIGVQQKDTLTQNKSRSDYFIRINQKFKMSTQHIEPLIIKNRDSVDKRQYNYSINPNYIEDVEKLLND